MLYICGYVAYVAPIQTAVLILIINGTRTYLSAEGNICCTEITVNCCCCMCVIIDYCCIKMLDT